VILGFLLGEFVVSHPNDKNKDVVGMGYPRCVLELGKAKGNRWIFGFSQENILLVPENESLGWVRGIPYLQNRETWGTLGLWRGEKE
jgi:hypothetical protein